MDNLPIFTPINTPCQTPVPSEEDKRPRGRPRIHASAEEVHRSKVEASRRYNERHKELRQKRGLMQRIINGRERLEELEALYLEKYGEIVEVE